MKFWFSLACSSLAAAVLLSVCPGGGEEDIYRDVLRLRVVAASDGTEDQEAKLEVRNAVLELVSGRVAECADREEAERCVTDMLDEIARTAQRCLNARGMRKSVTVRIGWEKSPRREYEGAALPAGSYRTLRVTIGEGVGQNWWCVLFPGICTGFAGDPEESATVGLTPREYRLITGSESGRIKVKFWILEKLGELCGSVR